MIIPLSMTKAQHSVFTKMTDIISQVAKPLSCIEEEVLWEKLRAGCLCDSIISISLKQAIKDEQPKNDIIDWLAGQAVDDIFTMSCSVGMETTILLLRSLPR